MVRFKEESAQNTAEQMDRLVKAVEEAERSAKAVKSTADTEKRSDGGSFMDRPISERWPSADNPAQIGGEVVEKTDDPEPVRIIKISEDDEDYTLPENTGELIDILDTNTGEDWETLSEVNQTLRKLEHSFSQNKLLKYVQGEQNPKELRFQGFTSALGRSVENYLTEIANSITIPDRSNQFSYGKGVIKGALGYKIGAAPTESDIFSYENLDEVDEDTLEVIGNMLDSLTESKSCTAENKGKYIKAFQIYGESDKTQKEIAEEVGTTPSSISRRTDRWQDAGLITEDGYTQEGDLMRELIEDVYSAK